MITRNNIARLVLWPTGSTMGLSLVDAYGEVIGSFKSAEPMRGQDVARLMPDGCSVLIERGAAIPVSPVMLHATKAPFDTVVNTERKTYDLEDRLSRLENKLVQSDRRALALKEKAEKLEKERADAEAASLVVEEPVAEPVAEGASPEPAAEPAAEPASGK